ncbi:MAG: DUF1801 domain-containing protein [Candidatus Kapabacteria bacterium]|nr:DUF1801 domain-containing protein [Candidatus Kapabacteria bacterium]
MAKAELKTKQTELSVSDFLARIPNEGMRADCLKVLKLMKKITKCDSIMWGTSIVGFGTLHLKYASGRELDWFTMGFSPRAANITIYLHGGFEQHAHLMSKLGKYKAGKGCLYIKKLADIDLKVLEELLVSSY